MINPMPGNVPTGKPPFRVVPPPPELDPSVIRDRDALEALRDAHTLDEISEMTGMASGTIQARSLRLGLTGGPPKGTAVTAETKYANDPEWLRARYIDEGLTAGEIAVRVGRSEEGLRKALHRHGIKKQR